MPEGYVNILFSKGLVLDDIIKLLNIVKFNLQKPTGEFLNVVGRVIPLYVFTDSNGKKYYIECARGMLSGHLAHSKSIYTILWVIIYLAVETLRNGVWWSRINLNFS